MNRAKKIAKESVLPSIVITDEILMKLPLESLMEFETGCKEWTVRLRENNFIFRHFDMSRERFLGIDGNVRIINPLTGVVRSWPVPQQLQPGRRISCLVHCDGVFLCRHEDKEVLGLRLGLWNPIMQQLEWISPRDYYGFADCYGIGYHRRGKFKVLRFFDLFPKDLEMADKFHEQHIEIFDTTTCVWRRKAATLDWRLEKSSGGLCLKGNMYWLALSMRVPSQSVFIQSFDFSREVFDPIRSLPEDLSYHTDHTNSLSVYKGDQLSWLHQGVHTRDIDVWVSTPLPAGKTTVTWSKTFSVSTPNLPPVHAHHCFDQPVYFMNAKDVVFVLCKEEDVTDEDSDVEQEPQVQIYRIAKDGMHQRIDMVQSAFDGGDAVCGYVYMPSRVPVPNLRGTD